MPCNKLYSQRVSSKGQKLKKAQQKIFRNLLRVPQIIPFSFLGFKSKRAPEKKKPSNHSPLNRI